MAICQVVSVLSDVIPLPCTACTNCTLSHINTTTCFTFLLSQIIVTFTLLSENKDFSGIFSLAVHWGPFAESVEASSCAEDCYGLQEEFEVHRSGIVQSAMSSTIGVFVCAWKRRNVWNSVVFKMFQKLSTGDEWSPEGTHEYYNIITKDTQKRIEDYLYTI